jgi:hypothetical protein
MRDPLQRIIIRCVPPAVYSFSGLFFLKHREDNNNNNNNNNNNKRQGIVIFVVQVIERIHIVT